MLINKNNRSLLNTVLLEKSTTPAKLPDLLLIWRPSSDRQPIKTHVTVFNAHVFCEKLQIETGSPGYEP